MDDLDDRALIAEIENISKKIDSVIKKVKTYEAEASKDTEDEDVPVSQIQSADVLETEHGDGHIAGTANGTEGKEDD